MRHLTPEAKVAELRQWEDVKATLRPDRPDAGGRGYPDPEMFVICDRLNALSGVCTLQSCAGHSPGESDGGSYDAQLWLWLDKPTARLAETIAVRLIDSPHIRAVRKHWLPGGREVFDVIFTPKHTAGFQEAGDFICESFECVSAAPPSRSGT